MDLNNLIKVESYSSLNPDKKVKPKKKTKHKSNFRKRPKEYMSYRRFRERQNHIWKNYYKFESRKEYMGYLWNKYKVKTYKEYHQWLLRNPRMLRICDARKEIEKEGGVVDRKVRRVKKKIIGEIDKKEMAVELFIKAKIDGYNTKLETCMKKAGIEKSERKELMKNGKLAETEAFKDLLTSKVSDDLITDRIREGLDANKVIAVGETIQEIPDHSARVKYIDRAVDLRQLKDDTTLRGAKSITINVIKPSDHEELEAKTIEAEVIEKDNDGKEETKEKQRAGEVS